MILLSIFKQKDTVHCVSDNFVVLFKCHHASPLEEDLSGFLILVYSCGFQGSHCSGRMEISFPIQFVGRSHSGHLIIFCCQLTVDKDDMKPDSSFGCTLLRKTQARTADEEVTARLAGVAQRRSEMRLWF